MRENEEKAFIEEYKKSLLKGQQRKEQTFGKPNQQIQQNQQPDWNTMSAAHKIEYIASVVVRHEAALKEFGPLLGLVMEALTREGIVEKEESKDANGTKFTQWKIKNKIVYKQKGDDNKVIC